jgi:malonyl-CoA O-methyltransferase
MPTSRPPTIDPHAVLRWQQLLVEPSPWLHEEVARRMAGRLDVIRLQPAAWAHWQPVKGGIQIHAEIVNRYPNSLCFIVESHDRQAQAATKIVANRWWNKAWNLIQPGNKTTRFEAPPDAAVQMLWANMALHMAADPQTLIAQWHKALAVDGFLMFSCLGPDTLRELRGLYQQLGWPAPSHEFTDMHDWGDMLVAAGFAEPVMDMERITLSFESPERLLAELRTLGRNLHAGRFGSLRGRAWRGELHRQLAQNLVNPKEGGRLTLTFEVIYGHALKPARRLNVQAETSVSLDEMRRNLQQRKGPKTTG